MPYAEYTQAVEIPPPATPMEFFQDFFNNYGMAEMGGQVELVGVAGFKEKRWNMVKTFVTKAKPGTAGARPLQGQYIHEALDDKHRMPDLVVAMKKRYEALYPVSWHSKNSLFYRWMDDYIIFFPGDVKAFLAKCFPNLPGETFEKFVTTGVEYLDKPAGRITYLVFFKNGKMYQKGKPFDTRNTRTFFSGPGWAIYVVSPRGLWFAGSHFAGKFQHSSFLGGRPILAAGEIQVDKGVPKVITAKSGHYTPTVDQFMDGLKRLQKLGVSMNELKVSVKDTQSHQRVLITAASYLVNKALRDRHSVW